MTKSIATGLLTFAALVSIAQAQEGAKAAAPEITTSYEGGKGFTVKRGEDFSLNVSGFLQANWSFANNEDAEDSSTFNVPRSRMTFKGNAFSKDLLYTLQLDASDQGSSGDGAIKEGHVTWNFVSGDYTMGVRLGQGKANYGFEGTGSSSGTFFVETSAATKGFANSYSRGAWLIGRGMENRLRWTLGAMNGDVANGLGSSYIDRGEESANGDNELSYNGTINFDPVGKLVDGNNESFRQGAFGEGTHGTVGLGFALGNGADNTGTTAAPVRGEDIESTSVSANTAWSIDSFQVMGEYFMRTDDLQGATKDEEESDGFVVSGTYILPKAQGSDMRWGFGLRYCMAENDAGDNGSVNYLSGLRGISSTEGEVTEITAVVNAFYHQHMAKTQIEVTKQDVEADAGGEASNYILTVAFQLAF